MRALTMDEVRFVSGGFDEDGWGSGPSHWLQPDPLKELEWDIMFGPFSGASSAQRILASEGLGFGGGAECPPASTEAQQIAGITGALAGAKKVWDVKIIRLLPPYIQAALYAASVIGGAVGGVLGARAAAQAECWLKNTKQGPFVS